MQEPIARGTPIILMILLVNLCLNPLLQTNMVTGAKSDPEAGLKDYEKCKIQFTPGVRLGLSGLGKGYTRILSLCQNWIAQISEMEAYPRQIGSTDQRLRIWCMGCSWSWRV